jgi:octaprenyl-diphosphate synthase
MPDALARDTLLRLADRYEMPRVRDGFTPIAATLASDLQALEAGLSELLDNNVQKVGLAAAHLLAAGGKRVRPVICMLTARAFTPDPPPEVRELAVVAEAIHNATLLHDDVIDLGESRRGRPTARLVYGNAASVLGGDLLLISALRVVDGAGTPELMTSLLSVLRRMISAESMQLENRGRADVPVADYFHVVDGKTASLFEWAVEAGARLGGADPDEVAALVAYGRHVGYAFQLLDDLLDLTQNPETVGKGVLADLGMGTVTYPVLLALQGRPALARRLEAASGGGEEDGALIPDLLAAVAAAGAVAITRTLITERTTAALQHLAVLEPSTARDALASVATALAERAR